MLRMHGFLLLCAGGLAPSVGKSMVALPHDRNMINTMAFGRYAVCFDSLVKQPESDLSQGPTPPLGVCTSH